MRHYLILSSILLVLSCGLPLRGEDAQSWQVKIQAKLKELDESFLEAISMAGSFENLLSNRRAQDHYYQALLAYHNGFFARQGYDLILRQLRDVAKVWPGVLDILMDTEMDGAPFEISLGARKSWGRRLGPDGFNYFSSLQLQMDDQGREFLEGSSRQRRLNFEKITETLQSLSENQHSEPVHRDGLSRRQRQLQAIQMRNELEEIKEFKNIAASLVRVYLGSESFQDILGAALPNADHLIEQLLQLKSRPDEIMRPIQNLIPLNVQDLLRAHVRRFMPNVDEWLASSRLQYEKDNAFAKARAIPLRDENGEIFPDHLQRQLRRNRILADALTAFNERYGRILAYDFRTKVHPQVRDSVQVIEPIIGLPHLYWAPIPRRVHGIWKGIHLGECVGGGQALANTTPRRWATVVLKSSILYHGFQANFAYSGFSQIVPIRHRQTQ